MPAECQGVKWFSFDSIARFYSFVYEANAKEVDARQLRTTPRRLMISPSLFICIAVASTSQRSPYHIKIALPYSNTLIDSLSQILDYSYHNIFILLARCEH